MNLADRKFDEGQKCFAEAELHETTSWLKWTPDFASSSIEFEKAANCFKIAKRIEECMESWRRAAVANLKNQDPLKKDLVTARYFEQAAECARTINNFNLLHRFSLDASIEYKNSGYFQRAAESLTSAAKAIEANILSDRPTVDVDHFAVVCIELRSEIIELYISDDKAYLCADHHRMLANLLLFSKRYREAIDVLKKQLKLWEVESQDGHSNRYRLTIIIIYLFCGDITAAQNYFHDSIMMGFSEEECDVAQQLLAAFSSRS
eukprot:TRINITY_DN11069_c0_g1_i1.p1 TRINITY_DN11069_c0_g1~~TRINITY_DN11069_c0_g1_i1.p1  ORF type:complete len:263 (-),score=78.33 TRINITY_DN11069_c0_g1_i1:142-930(-)